MRSLLMTGLATAAVAVTPAIAGFAPTGGLPPATSPCESPTSDSASSAWTEHAFAHLEALEYRASSSADGLQAPNRAQDLRTFFRAGHVDVVPRRVDETTPWSFRWSTDRWGRRGSWATVEPSAPVADGPRVVYRGAGLTEWYENRPEGIEQGFTIEQRPIGEGPLSIEGTIGNGLRAKLADTRDAIDLYDPNNVHVLHYGGLRVSDAEGRNLEAWFELPSEESAASGDRTDEPDSRIALVADDEGATYPLTVDPVLETLDWVKTGTSTGDAFGWAVATAGDVNGDGFSDVLVSAMRYDFLLADQGAVFLYLGSAGRLSSAPAWIGLGEAASDQYGWDAETAGDVNGDGYDDVIVGAIYHEETMNRQGRAYLYYGSPDGLSDTPAWTFDGETEEAVLGTAVGTAGDVDGDGFDDVIVGSSDFVGVGTDEGRAYVFHGSAGGLSASPAWTADGGQPGARFGYRAGTAGDVNADGYDDVVVGAYLYDEGETDEGKAWVYHGSPTGLESTAAWSVAGEQESALMGRDVGMAGDVNGDGYGDVIVGVAAIGVADYGGAFVFAGSPTGLGATPFWIRYGTSQSHLGTAVGTAGDVDGDGFADVIVGAPNYSGDGTGLALIFRGSPTGMVEDSTTNRDGPGSEYGRAVATAGDVDGDGFSDVLVGAWLSSEGGSEHGAAFLYRGSARPVDTAASWSVESGQAHARLGIVSSAGDVNGDGLSDVIVGAPSVDVAGTDSGAAIVYLGESGGLSANPAWVTFGPSDQAGFGASVSRAGDVNGDGRDDIIIGAPNADGQTGTAFVFLGSPSGVEDEPVWIGNDGVELSVYGSSVAGAGDVNGDGFADIIVGARFFPDGAERPGAAFLYLGSSAGPSAVPDWSVVGDQADSRFGYCVAGAGDVDADGYGDVIVGAPYYTDPGLDQGAAFVYHGSAGGLEATPSWIMEGSTSGQWFGAAVAAAGDVDGDGYSDVIIGAPRYSTPSGSYKGLAFAYRGGSGGLASFHSWRIEGLQTGSFLGESVSSAGDVNADGYSDVLVGLPGSDTSPTNTNGGRARVYLGSLAGLEDTPSSEILGSSDFEYLGGHVSTAEDVNGDGFSDVILGMPDYDGDQPDEGVARLYLGNGTGGPGVVAQQRRTDDSAPIALGGLSDSPTSFLVTAVGHSAKGRDGVRMQVEVKPADVPFDGMGTISTDPLDTGLVGVPLDALVTGLESDGAYRWRLRILSGSPYFPHSPWFSPQGNAPTELDLRTPSGPVGVGPSEMIASAIRLAPASPNPFRTSTALSFAVAAAGRGRVAIFDVSGRRVALLADRWFGRGVHDLRWDGRTDRGLEAANGVYRVRLAFRGSIAARSIILAR